MALTAKVLNVNASLNSYKIVNSVDFFPGSQITLKLRIFDPDENDRYIPPSTVVASVQCLNSDGSQLTLTPAMDPNDRSMWTVTITGAQSANLVGGNVIVKLDLLGDGTQVLNGVVVGALRKVTLDF